MNDFADRIVSPSLVFLGEWSLRWGLLIAALAVWFAVRPPRRASVRHGLCLAALAAGLLLPITPRWGFDIEWKAATPAPVAVVQPVESPHLEPIGSVPTEPITHLVMDETSIPMPEPVHTAPALNGWSLAAMLVAGVWMLLTLGVFIRLGIGLIGLKRLRRNAVDVDAASQRLLAECRDVLGLHRAVALKGHGGVASPITLGGRHPVILVPMDWDTRPESERKVCLLHELAHLVRGDDWAKLVQELIRPPFAFHPLVRWLFARLDREREWLCDEAVVARGVDPVTYARVLLDFARRPRWVTVQTGPCGLAFFDRGTVAARIHRLLEADMTSDLSQPSSRKTCVVVALALVAALGLGGLSVRAVEPAAQAKTEVPAKPLPEAKPAAAQAKTIEQAGVLITNAVEGRVATGLVLDADDHPLAGATVYLRVRDEPGAGVQGLTGENGRFSFPLPTGRIEYAVFVLKGGSGVQSRIGSLEADVKTSRDLGRFKLIKSGPFVATLVDREGKPVSGAKVRVEAAGFAYRSANSRGMSFAYYRKELVAGSPLDALFETTTDALGTFRFTSLPEGACPRLLVTDPDRGAMRVERKLQDTFNSLNGFGAVDSSVTAQTKLTVEPAAKLVGQVVSTVRGVSAAGRRIHLESLRLLNNRDHANSAETAVDADGKFTFDGLFPGKVVLSLRDADPKVEWIYRHPMAVLESGKTASERIELVVGLSVEGKVVSTEGFPVQGILVRAIDPKSGLSWPPVKTDVSGIYTLRALAGEVKFSIADIVAGYSRTQAGSDQTVIIPADAKKFTGPILRVEESASINGRVVDAQDKPIPGAKVFGASDRLNPGGIGNPSAVTDASGKFTLSERGAGFPLSRASSFQVQLPDGKTFFYVQRPPPAAGELTLKVPTIQGARTKGPETVAPDELAGRVVDDQGKPIADVEVRVYHWMPKYITKTDANGWFHYTKFIPGNKVEVRFVKEGFETQHHLDVVVGKPGWLVVLGNKTYFEGTVFAPNGSPVPNALIRADSGPRQASGLMLDETITETTSGPDGKYRLYVEPSEYDIAVRVPGTGVTRLKQGIAADQVRTLDLRLTKGATFIAHCVDHQTKKPVAGVKLDYWNKPGVEGTSDANGLITINDLPPGAYRRFQVKANGYVRWWSAACLSEWTRYEKANRFGFQRNFDNLDFEITPGMPEVTIELERGVTIKGRVLDPAGKPVAGATVAPALTGSGNSLTGDTRFSVTTEKDGQFTMNLPASGDIKYNLVAHDGTYQEWRTWANGVAPPMQTTPGQVVDGLELRLTNPGTVTGRVMDASGKPVAGREVRSEPTDKNENRYYDPTTETAPDGTFTLKFVRPGEHFIQVAPFWLEADQAPAGSSQVVTVEAGKVKAGVQLKADAESR